MSWLKIDDTLTDHPKWVAVLAEARQRIESRAGSRQAAKDAYLAWFASMVWGSGVNCDGVLPETAAAQIAPRVALTEDEFLDAAPLLVVAGLWHQIGARGRRCDCWRDKKPSTATGWIVHDWSDFQPSKQQVRTKADKAANHTWLHRRSAGKKVKALVVRRDGNWCRYCGIECSTNSDHRSPLSRTFDFVDPDIEFDRSPDASIEELERVADGIVVSCGYCNGRKNNRTPEQAGMVLRGTPEQVRQTQSRLGRDPVAPGARPGHALGSGRTGSDRVGSGLEAPAGSVQDDPWCGVSVLAQRLEQDGLLSDPPHP